MLLVLSSLYDQYATAGAAALRAKGTEVAVVTCHDLAQPGWKLTLEDEPTLVVGGKPVAAKNIDGVITRISGVTAAELPFVHVDDRDYAASEMQAFLLALLTTLTCPVLNRPQPGCLNGPPWIAEQWTACAARAGVAVRPIVRRAYAGGLVLAPEEPAERRVVHVVGDQGFGDAPAAVRDAAVSVAKAAGVDLLRAGFDVRGKAPVFLDADPWVDITDTSVADAIRRKVAA